MSQPRFRKAHRECAWKQAANTCGSLARFEDAEVVFPNVGYLAVKIADMIDAKIKKIYEV